MAKITNTFIGGMSRDTSPVKQDNQHTYYVENFRITDNNGLSKTSLKNEPGNTIAIKFPEPTGPHTVSDYLFLTHTFIRGDLILLSIIDNSLNPTYSIYRITNAQLLNAIKTLTPIEVNDNYYHSDINFPNNQEDIVNNLVYRSSQLNFDPDYEIKAFAVYESPLIQKLYISDELNGFRYLNLIHDSDYNDLTNSNLNLYSISQVSINPPVPTVYNGGNIPVGKVQYAVQFYSTYGAESFFSPISNPVFISNSVLSPRYNYQLRGGNEGDISNKSVSLSISLNTAVSTTLSEFSRMRCVAIEYSTPTLVPTIRVFYDSNIDNNATSLNVLDTGVSLGTISLEEFRGLANFLFTPKYINSKDNYLFAANIKETFFDIGTYDSRAYRFNTTSVSYLFETDGSYYTLTSTGGWTKGTDSGTDWSIPLTADCINRSNSLTPAAYNNNYQKDGSTVGAEGKNIKLEVIKTPVYIDTAYLDTTTVEIIDSPLSKPTTGVLGYYLSGEVYRIGIVFRNSFGVRSRPQWVCDLRFPDHYEQNSLISNRVFGSTLYYSYHLKATVKTMPVGAESWEIVRCRRTDIDKTILGYGVLKALAEVTFDEDDILAFSDVPLCDSVASNLEGEPLSLRDDIFGFISPDFLIDNLVVENDYYFKTIGLAYDRLASSGTLFSLGYPGFEEGNASYATRIKYRGIEKCGSNDFEELSILDSSSLQEEPFGVYGNIVLNGETKSIRNLTFRLTSSSDSDEYGQGGKANVIKFTSSPDVSYSNFNPYDLLYGYVHRDSYSSIYGGNTYSSRINSEYISCGSESVRVNSPVSVYGGDTFPGMFTYTNSHILPDSETPTMPGGSGNKIYSYFSFPVECSYNLYLSNGISSTSESTNVASCMMRTVAGAYRTLSSTNMIYVQEKGLYDYNRSYSRDLDGQKFLSEEDLYRESEFDCRIYGSNLKTNGELSDSWLKFTVDNFIDVDTRYGPITHLFLHNDILYFFQEKAFGYLPINEEATITTNTNAKLSLASSGILERVKYISTESGVLNHKELTATKYGIFWVDRLNKSICQFSGTQGSLEDLKLDKDMESYINSFTNYDHPIYVGYNDDKKDVYFSNETLDKTLLYNVNANSFVEVQSFSSDHFIKVDKYCLSRAIEDYGASDNFSNFYLQGYGDKGNFYGTVSPSILHFIVNPGDNGIYETIEWFSECMTELGVKTNKTFTNLRVKTGYQDSGELSLSLSTNLGQRFRTWFTPIPRALYDLNGVALERTDSRMRDYYLLVEVEFDNTNNDSFEVNEIITNVTHGNAKPY